MHESLLCERSILFETDCQRRLLRVGRHDKLMRSSRGAASAESWDDGGEQAMGLAEAQLAQMHGASLIVVIVIVVGPVSAEKGQVVCVVSDAT